MNQQPSALRQVFLENPTLPALGDNQLEQLQAHVDLLARWNRVQNLTRVEEPLEVARRHCADSLAGLRLLTDLLAPDGGVADVGSGAGFPGIPAAILWPERPIVLVEALRKRASFLRQVVHSLGLRHVTVENCRQEQVPHGSFQLVLTRATLPWPQLGTLGKLLRPGGSLAAWSAEEPTAVQWTASLSASGFAAGERREYQLLGLPPRAVLVGTRAMP
ncbi:MAG: 16S rRNA (guanine(527)-N(7))-methyltransferase RsmG [Myxococcota bacterium]